MVGMIPHLLQRLLRGSIRAHKNMQNLNTLLTGKRTYIAIAASAIFYLLQVNGLANWVSEAELNNILNVTVQLGLAIYTAYARYLATKG